MFKLHLIAMLMGVISWAGVAQAQYLLVLKNGRQIHVQSYRDDGSMIKFSGLGGEIAISKDQVQTIRRVGEGDLPGLCRFQMAGPGPGPSPAAQTSPLPDDRGQNPEASIGSPRLP